MNNMENLVELNENELKEINGGSLFPILRAFKVACDIAKAGWEFGRWLAKE